MSSLRGPRPSDAHTRDLHSDLALGSIYYRKLINVASGWVHHTVYTFLFSYVLHRRWTYIAATGAIFELPTFVMGIASMFPRLRSNMGFTATFFLTRIFFHFALIVTMATANGRAAPFVDGSWTPFACITLPFPMHLWWGYKAVRSMRRRAAKRKLAKKAQLESDNSFAVSAGQFFNGVAPPDVASALNTPATTPGGARAETNFGSTTPVHAAFAKAVAAAGVTTRPMRIFIGKRDKPSQRASSASGGGYTSSAGSSRLPSGRATPSIIEIAQNPFTAPVAPDGADASAKEPFLAIRSPAETSDRARRLIADAVRKAWNNAPEAWRKQVEAEARMRPVRIPLDRAGKKAGSASGASTPQGKSGRSNYYVSTGTAEGSDTGSESISSADEYDDGALRLDGYPEDDELFDDAQSDIYSSPVASPRNAAYSTATFQAQQRERGRKAAARRAVIRAVRRAINGKNADGSDSGIAANTLFATRDADDGDDDALRRYNSSGSSSDADAAPPPRDRTLGPVDLSELLKRLPPGIGLGGWNQNFQVREFPVERDETESRRRRILGQIRRRMEVARRDVMVFD